MRYAPPVNYWEEKAPRAAPLETAQVANIRRVIEGLARESADLRREITALRMSLDTSGGSRRSPRRTAPVRNHFDN